MKKINLCLVGANGRMGLSIKKCLTENNNFNPSVAISKEGATDGFKYSSKNFNGIEASQTDVIIDFSSTEMLKKTVGYAVKNGIPLVVGVTGLDELELKTLKEASKKTAILYSPNMSVGVAILKSALKIFSECKNFDFQIIESHHIHKKDSPSGTALALQNSLETAIRKKVPAPLSIRGGGIIGDHQILAMSEHEIISFKHQAINRDVFAIGAIKAAEWIIKNKNGFFTMDDVLKGV